MPARLLVVSATCDSSVGAVGEASDPDVDTAMYGTCVAAETVELNCAARRIVGHPYTTISPQSDFVFAKTAERSATDGTWQLA